MIPTIPFLGFMALILGELISYLFAEQGEPKWILRHGDKVVYAYVLYVTIVSVLGLGHPHAAGRRIGSIVAPDHGALYAAIIVGFIVVRLLIWIDIAIILRKVVPIIRESKTLV
jgi:hypothetical protein